MAHTNIDARRAAVAAQLAERGTLSRAERSVIAEEFGCSEFAIYSDMLMLQRPQSIPSPYLTPGMRDLIRARDRGTCQYCGDQDDSSQTPFIVEHVIPIVSHGVGRAYNLVLACNSCNATKRSETWVPRNLDAITVRHPEWRERILATATRDTR